MKSVGLRAGKTVFGISKDSFISKVGVVLSWHVPAS